VKKHMMLPYFNTMQRTVHLGQQTQPDYIRAPSCQQYRINTKLHKAEKYCDDWGV
jgi:hypothetical protein